MKSCTRWASSRRPARGSRAWNPFLVVLHRPGAAARQKLEQGGRSERRPIAQVEELLEALPCRRALRLLFLDEPKLSLVLQVVGSHPRAFRRHDVLLDEEGLALVDEDERVRLAVVPRKLQAPMLGGLS